MNIEKPSRTNLEQQNVYPKQLENVLGLGPVIDEIEREFDKFNKDTEKENTPTNELDTLRLIKIFLFRDQNKIREIIKNSRLPGFDCLSMCVITCLLTQRKGYEVTIGRPDKLSRYLHALIIMSNGDMFKVAGRNRNYGVKGMAVHDVVKRLKYMGPIVSTLDSIKSKVRGK